jgi:hypothetical protein
VTRTVAKSALLALGLLLAAELGVRVFFARNMSARFEYGYHPTAGFVERADGTVSLVRAGGRRFHPQSFQRTPAPGMLRVFVVGDSVPRGPSLAQSYAARIGVRLRDTGVQAECYNLAVPGLGAHRSQLVLQQALTYQPGLIVLHVNNSNEYEDEREWKRKQEFAGWHPKNWLMKSLVVRRLHEARTEQLLWKWLPLAIRSQRSASDADAEIQASLNTATLQRWDQRVRRFVAQSVQLCRERGVPVLLITQAVRSEDSSRRLVLEDRVTPLVQSLAGPRVVLLPMQRVFERHDIGRLYADTSHVRAEGHQLLAEAIVEIIRQPGLLR